MSISEELRDELAQIVPARRCCRLAELSALFHASGAWHLRGGAVAVYNRVRGEQHGITVGIYNRARSLHGLQLGVLNHVEDAHGIWRWMPVFNFHR